MIPGRFIPQLFLAAITVLSPIGAFARQAAPEAGDPLLAERFADLASETLRRDTLSTAQYREAAAFLEAASRLVPTEPRYPRLRHEALMSAGEIDGSLEALIAYARLDVTDLAAQARIIELYAQRMETADEKIKYLRSDLLTTGTIPAEVRSHAALLAARVQLERGDRPAAVGLAGEACRLNPLNAEAQKLNFELSAKQGTPVDRLRCLLAIVRASPLDVQAVGAVADELNKVGIGDAAAQWYDAALGLYIRNGAVPVRQLVNDYAARMLVNGNTRDALGLAERVLQADPDDLGAHVIRLASDRAQASGADPVDRVVVQHHIVLARTSLTNRLAEVAKSAGDTTATTRPSNTVEAFPVPDPVKTAELVLKGGSAELKEAYIAAAGNLAWLHLYFSDDAAAAKDLIEGLRHVLPPDSTMLARLEGWYFLVAKQPAEARLKLAAVAERDALAALGLLRLDSQETAATQPSDSIALDTRARGIYSNNSSGLIGALVFAELASRKTPFVPSAQAETMKGQLNDFPIRILRLIDSPQNFFFMRAEPVVANVGYGEPMLVKVTLINTSQLDLPLGANGAIRPDLWFDAQTRGLNSASYPGTAYDRFGGPMVLHPGQSVTRIVRLDQGRLLAYLRSVPNTSTAVSGSVITNPAVVNDRIVSGAGGYTIDFNRFIEQAPVPIASAEQRQALISGLSSAPTERRVPMIDAAVTYVRLLETAQGAEVPQIAAAMRSAVDALLSDPNPVARSWGTFQGLLLSTGDTRAAKARTAIKDPNWTVRLLALSGFRGGDTKALRETAVQLSSDSDVTVAKYARALIDELDDLPATRPATQPASH